MPVRLEKRDQMWCQLCQRTRQYICKDQVVWRLIVDDLKGCAAAMQAFKLPPGIVFGGVLCGNIDALDVNIGAQCPAASRL